jgi:hypothetical protein
LQRTWRGFDPILSCLRSFVGRCQKHSGIKLKLGPLALFISFILPPCFLLRGHFAGVNCITHLRSCCKSSAASKFTAAISSSVFASLRLRCKSSDVFCNFSNANLARLRTASILSCYDCCIGLLSRRGVLVHAIQCVRGGRLALGMHCHLSPSAVPAGTLHSRHLNAAGLRFFLMASLWPGLSHRNLSRPLLKFSARTTEYSPRVCQSKTPRCGAHHLGVYSGRAHWGEGTPKISMASEYNAGVSGDLRQAVNNVASGAVLPVGTLIRAVGRVSRYNATISSQVNLKVARPHIWPNIIAACNETIARGWPRCSRCTWLEMRYCLTLWHQLGPGNFPEPFFARLRHLRRRLAAEPSRNRPSSGAGRQASAIRKGEVHQSARRACGDFQRFIGKIEGKRFILRIQRGVGHSIRCHG